MASLDILEVDHLWLEALLGAFLSQLFG
jgi:hypothetical protein